MYPEIVPHAALNSSTYIQIVAHELNIIAHLTKPQDSCNPVYVQYQGLLPHWPKPQYSLYWMHIATDQHKSQPKPQSNIPRKYNVTR